MKVGVFGGAGAVGAATAAALLTGGIAETVLLTDVNADHLAVQRMDLELVAGAYGAQVQTVDAAGLAEADIIVMAAGVAHRDGADRADFAVANLAILDRLLDALPADWPGAFVVASNPVDVLATAIAGRLGARSRVLGYVANDSLRLAAAIAQVRGCRPVDVEAWAVGEHGPGLIALFDRVTIAGVPAVFDDTARADILRRVLGWYDEWQGYGTGRTSMWTTGAGVAALIARYTAPEMTLLPLSVPLRGSYGVPGPVCLGVPVLVGFGRTEVVEWQLTDAQTPTCARLQTRSDGLLLRMPDWAAPEFARASG